MFNKGLVIQKRQTTFNFFELPRTVHAVTQITVYITQNNFQPVEQQKCLLPETKLQAAS